MAGVISKITAGGATHYIATTVYCRCETAAATAAKVAKVIGAQSDSASSAEFTLLKGTTIHVWFKYTNSASGATLNVAGTGAKAIRCFGAQSIGSGYKNSWRAEAIVELTYDGASWVMNSGWDFNSTYSCYSESEGSTTTSLVTRGEKYTWNHGIADLTSAVAPMISSSDPLTRDFYTGEYVCADGLYRFNNDVASGSDFNTNVSNGNIQQTTVDQELAGICRIIEKTTSVTNLTNTLCTWRYREFANGYIDGYGIISATWSHYTAFNGFYGYYFSVNLPVTFGDIGCIPIVSWNIGSSWGISGGVKGNRTTAINGYALCPASGAQVIIAMIKIKGMKA